MTWFFRNFYFAINEVVKLLPNEFVVEILMLPILAMIVAKMVNISLYLSLVSESITESNVNLNEL